jgi:O-antigen/teichoic acid export membrane protein
LQPAVMLGLGVGLPRYIALAQGQASADRVSHYFGTTVRYVALATFLVVAALLFAKDAFAYLLYGSVGYRYLIPPLALMLVGLALHSVIYAYLRGHLSMGRANVLNLANLGLAPALVFIWFHTTARSLLWALGVVWTGIALAALAWTPLRALVRSSRTERRELLSYGLQRVPGDFVLLALLALPAIFTAHAAGIEKAGYVAFGTSLSNMIAAMFASVGVILLPKASRSAGNGLLAELRAEVRLMVLVAVVVSTMIIAVFEIYAPSFVHLYLGRGFESSVVIVRIVLIAAMPLALYYVLRSIVDAFHHRAVNAVNLFASLLIFLAGSSLTFWIHADTPLILWSFVVGTACLAILTLREVLLILRPKDESLQ